jgi:hypothetical protein
MSVLALIANKHVPTHRAAFSPSLLESLLLNLVVEAFQLQAAPYPFLAVQSGGRHVSDGLQDQFTPVFSCLVWTKPWAKWAKMLIYWAVIYSHLKLSKKSSLLHQIRSTWKAKGGIIMLTFFKQSLCETVSSFILSFSSFFSFSCNKQHEKVHKISN